MRPGSLLVAATAFMLSACAGESAEAPQSGPSATNANGVGWPSDWVSATGDIALPDGFDTWPTLGAWGVAGPDGVATGMHQGYASPGTIEAFRRDGKFADGSVLVKEVRGASTAALTTGAATYATENQVWFVMVKDSTNRFADNPIWGDGWGWALFEAGDRSAQVAQDYTIDCQGCHIPAQDNDWIYVEAYPVLFGENELPNPTWQSGEG